MTYQMAFNSQMQAAGGSGQPPVKSLATTAAMIRSVVEDHHIKLEEDHVFPLFQKAGKQTDLVNTLREQHATARRLTDTILQMTSGNGQNAGMEPLARHIMAYTHMIRAHTAYEETLLYPQIRAMLSENDYNQLQKTIADADRQKLGPEGFSGLLVKVTDLEKSVGITGLAQFTPKLGEPVARESSGG
jgi:hemerythrin-like domain-containing protein